MKYSLVENKELINDLVLHSVYGVDVYISSNYRGYIKSLRFLTFNDEYYFKTDDEFYKCPATITVNNILDKMYADFDHLKNSKSDEPIQSIMNVDSFDVEIYENGSILYG
jgi:hypothetical protein